jgi:hypothetical protein
LYKRLNKNTKSKRGKKGSSNKQNQSLTRLQGNSYMGRGSLTNPTFLPRRLIVNVKQQMLGYYNTTTAMQGGFFVVAGSSLFEPFGSVATQIGSTGANKSNISLNGAYGVATNPVGYTFINSNYSYYKVRRARLTVEAQPAAGADGCILEGYPSTAQQAAFSPVYASAQPNARQVFAVNGSRPKTLVLETTAQKVLGYSPVQFEGIPPTLTSTSPGATLQWFFNVVWDTCDGAAPAQQINFNINLYQEVEVSELIIETS